MGGILARLGSSQLKGLSMVRKVGWVLVAAIFGLGFPLWMSSAWKLRTGMGGNGTLRQWMMMLVRRDRPSQKLLPSVLEEQRPLWVALQEEGELVRAIGGLNGWRERDWTNFVAPTWMDATVMR